MSDGSRPAESAEIDGSGIGASGGANKIGGERGERREQGRQLGWEGRGACRTAGAGRARSSGICGRVRGRARGGAARRSGGAGEQGRRCSNVEARGLFCGCRGGQEVGGAEQSELLALARTRLHYGARGATTDDAPTIRRVYVPPLRRQGSHDGRRTDDTTDVGAQTRKRREKVMRERERKKEVCVYHDMRRRPERVTVGNDPTCRAYPVTVCACVRDTAPAGVSWRRRRPREQRCVRPDDRLSSETGERRIEGA